VDDQAAAPPVVAVVVVHQPGPWFDETLDGLAEQDYPNLRCLFLVAGEPADVPTRVRARVRGAFVRAAQGNPGFASVANEVLSLVEGDNGFFCFLHDDVALDPSAIRLLVEEVYRSNAGIVGPKLVEWDDPGVLQHVGLGVDRFGETDSLIEPGELDQEQHDSVRDVFAVPSACLLARADLFRSLGGFRSEIDFHYEDVDLCWRAQLSGARVLVVPAARGRHRERLVERRPDIAHERRRAEHRIHAVATYTGRSRVVPRMVQTALLSCVELVVGIFTGRARTGAASLWATIKLLARLGGVLAARRAIRGRRLVPDGEVAGLQVPGSARFSAFLRHRGNRKLDADELTARRWRQSAGSAPAIAWVTLIAMIVIGSRQLLRDGVPPAGEFLPFPDSARALLGDYRSGFVGQGAGNGEAAPTALALLGAGGAVLASNMGLLHTVTIVGLLVVAAAGMWWMASIFPTPRARITAMVTYVALPLPAHLLSVGRWRALLCYAALPWVVHLIRRLAGLGTDTLADEPESESPLARRARFRVGARLALLCAVVFAFVPAFSLVIVAAGALLAVGTVVARGSLRAAVVLLACGLTMALVGALLNLPWSASILADGGWASVVGVQPSGARSIGAFDLLTFGIGNGRFASLGVLLYLPLVAAVLTSSGWRTTWAVRAAFLVLGFGWLTVMADRDVLPIAMPEPGILLAGVAVGLALAAGCLVASLADDVFGGHLGWRQPLAILATVGLAGGMLPGLYSTLGGRWHLPNSALPDVLGQMPTNPPDGDYRVLWIGEPEVMPTAAWTFEPGVALALTQDGPLDVREHFVGAPSDTEMAVADALRETFGTPAAPGAMQHLGRLLAPFGIRYIVLPVADGAVAPTTQPRELLPGLREALGRQLDLSEPITKPLNIQLFENVAWAPVRSTLPSDAAVGVSNSASSADLSRTDIGGGIPFAVAQGERGPWSGAVGAGTLHVATPFDERWELVVDGVTVDPRPAFGVTTAFEVPTAGEATLRYRQSGSRTLGLALQVLAWLTVALVASRLTAASFRRRVRIVRGINDGPMIDLAGPPPERSGVQVPWRDPTGEIDRAKGASADVSSGEGAS
jgi:GT2 family glycosyltransferase